MKKHIKQNLGAFLIMASFIAVSTASAQGMMGQYYGQQGVVATSQAQNTEIANALKDIFNSQGVTDQNQIECGNVSDTQFENLGDAYMGAGLTEEQHSAMDNMMGGEGSPTLDQAHINMGRAYLGCWSNYNSGPQIMPMMGQYGDSFSRSYNGYGNMMGWGWPSMMEGYYGGGYQIFGWVTMLLFWVLLVLGIVTAVRWLKRNK